MLGEMSTTGNFVDAATALSWGLVNDVVPHDELLPLRGQARGRHRLERCFRVWGNLLETYQQQVDLMTNECLRA